MNIDAVVREQLRTLLKGGNAHMTFDEAVAQFPVDRINTRPPHVPYTPWHLLEYIRLSQWDILDFIRNPQYVSGRWPEDYWPPRDAMADQAAWEKTLASFCTDQRALFEMLDDPAVNLYEPIPHGQGQTTLREIQLVADHNAYHIGEFAILRQVMETWGNQEH